MKKLIVILAIVACASIAQAQQTLQPYPNAGREIPMGYHIPDTYERPRGVYVTQPFESGPVYGFGNDSRDNFIIMPTPSGFYVFGERSSWRDDCDDD